MLSAQCRGQRLLFGCGSPLDALWPGPKALKPRGPEKGHLQEQNSSSPPGIVCLKIQNPNEPFLDQEFTFSCPPLLSFTSCNGCPAGIWLDQLTTRKRRFACEPRKDWPKLGTTSGWSWVGSWGNLISDLAMGVSNPWYPTKSSIFWDLSHYKPPIFWGPPSRLFGTPPVRTTQCSLSVKTGWFQSLWPPRFNSVQETFLVAASDGFWANGISGTTRQCFLCTIRCSIV